jgi:hypothetical protein
VKDKWVAKSKWTDQVFGIDTEERCQLYADWMNEIYQTDEYIAEPYDPRKSWVK